MKILPFLKRHAKIAGAVGGAILLILILLGLSVSTTQLFERPDIGQEDWMRQSRITMNVMRDVFRRESDELVRMKLSAPDVRTLLRFAVNQDSIRNVFSGKETTAGVAYRADYADGCFSGSWIIGPAWGPFRFILHGSAKITYSGNQFIFDNLSGRIGHLPVPAFILRPVIRKLLVQADRNVYVQKFHQAVESIAVTPDGLEIVYRPRLLRSMIGAGGFSL